MADNIAVLPSTDATAVTVAMDEVTDGTLGSCKVQYVKLMDGAIDGTAKLTISSSGEMLVKGGVTVAALTTASKIQVEAPSALPVSFTTASKAQIDALTTASKIQTEFAAAQPVTLTTASKVQVDALTTASKVQIDALTTASKIQTEFAAAQPVTLSTASKVQVEFAAAQAVTFTTASKAQIDTLTTANKIQVEFAAAQAVTLTTASKVQTEFATAQPITVTTASKVLVQFSSESKAIADITTASKIVADITTASKIVAESVGDTASGSADAGNPVKIGGKAAIALPTTVAAGNRVNALYDTLGRQIVSGTLRENLGIQVTAVTSVEANIVTSTSGLRDLYGLVLANTGATATQVDIRDTTGGTIRASFYVPATDTRGFMLPVDSAVPQATTGSAWTATNVTTSATLRATAFWVTRL